MIPDIGDAYTWTPTAWTFGSMCKTDFAQGAAKTVRGRVVYVNLEHGWYRVEGETPGGVIRECFHFFA